MLEAYYIGTVLSLWQRQPAGRAATRDAWEVHKAARDGQSCNANPIDGIEPEDETCKVSERIKDKTEPLLQKIFGPEFLQLIVRTKVKLDREIRGDEMVSIMVEAMRATWVWAAQAKTTNAMALRLYVMLYVFEPALVEGITLQKIGQATNNSRQHVHALLDDFRDTFGVTNHLQKDSPKRNR